MLVATVFKREKIIAQVTLASIKINNSSFNHGCFYNWQTLSNNVKISSNYVLVWNHWRPFLHHTVFYQPVKYCLSYGIVQIY